jgi:hypothetical protein
MNKPTSINARRRNPLSYELTRGLFLEGALFFGGVAVTVVLPELICSLIASLLIGIGWGVIRYNWLPFEIISCISKEPVPRTPHGAAVKLKLAA